MTTTTYIKFSTPAHGSNVDTWSEDPVNNNSLILDAVLGKVTSKALTNVDVTLTATELQTSTLRFSGILTGNVAVNVAAIQTEWSIQNRTTGAFVVTITGGSGNVVGVPQGDTVKVQWDGINCEITSLERVGTYVDDCGSVIPPWVTACTVPPFLLCDGSTFSSGTYPYLAAKLGSTTLPDLRGRSRAYLNGGTGRITTAGSGIDGDTRFSAGGQQNRTVAQANLTSFNFPVTDPGHFHTTPAAAKIVSGGSWQGGSGQFFTLSSQTDTALTGISVASGGTSTPLPTMPPAQISGITMIRAA